MPNENEEVAKLQAALAQMRRHLKRKNEKIVELRDNLARSHRWLVGKNEEMAKLRAQIALAGRSLGEDAPMFFVVGRGRSGTTWLMDVLNSHPEILCRGEGWLFNRNFRREDFKELHHNLKPASLYNAIAESEYLRLWVQRSVWAAHEDPEEHLDNLTRLAVEYFLTNKARKASKKIVGDKTTFFSGEVLYGTGADESGKTNPQCNGISYNGAVVLEEIARIMPEAKVIHIVRDGRDVAVSVMHFMWNRARGEEGGIYELVPEELAKRDAYREDSAKILASGGIFTEERLRAIARSWRTEVGEAIGRGAAALGNRYAEVRYEELLRRPKEEVGRLLAFLGADPSVEAVRGCVESAGVGRLSDRQKGGGSTSVRLRKGVAGDWRNVFTERDKRIFKEEAGDLLIELGYEKDGVW